MNKKVGIFIGILAIILILAIAVWFYSSKNGKKEFNLQELNTTISEKEPFSQMAMMEVDAEVLQNSYEISEEEYEEAIGKMPLINVNASMYLIIKAKDGKVDTVREKVEKYAQTQERIWSTYLPEQYDLVKQRRQGVVENYVYLIIAENAEEIEAFLK